MAVTKESEMRAMCVWRVTKGPVCTGQPYLVVLVGAVKTVEVGLVAVLVPPASHVSPGTVDPQRIGVLVPC